MNSFEVKALNSPPIPSIKEDISRAVGRFFVPLKNMCSAKCAIPLYFFVSLRLPTFTNINAVDDLTGKGAVITLNLFLSITLFGFIFNLLILSLLFQNFHPQKR